MIIGIEGPAGSGKTTMARAVGSELGFPVVESGAWYRALAYLAASANVSPTDTLRLVALADTMTIDTKIDEDDVERTFLNGHDITSELYGGAISETVGIIAHEIPVREALMPRIAVWIRQHGDVIIVGRHLKKLLPEARVLRLVIDPDEAERRHANRAAVVTHAVASRNAIDQDTAALLGITTGEVTELDVTDLTPIEQIEALRRFIAAG